MRKITCVLLVAAMLLCGCSGSGSKSEKAKQDRLCMEDFSFYDYTGREIEFLTESEDFLSVNLFDDDKEKQTYREVRVGDRASTALEKYDLSDFRWGIESYKWNSDELDSLADSLESKYKDYDASQILDYIDDICSNEDIEIHFTCTMYVVDNKLCTYEEAGKGIASLDLEQYRITFKVLNEKINQIFISRDN